MNFITFLAGSTLVNTFFAMVRSMHRALSSFQRNSYSSHTTPLCSPTWAICSPLKLFSFSPQTGPAAGISFCLIIVRLGQILPESSPTESWHMSIPTPSTQTPESDGQLTDVFATDSKVDNSHSDDPPSVVRTSLTLPSPVT